MVRVCGECRVCCRIIPVDELAKPAGVGCIHTCDLGCAKHENKPRECAKFSCLWMSVPSWLHGLLTDACRPDRVGIMLVGTRHGVTVYETRQGAAKEGFGKKMVHRLATAGIKLGHPLEKT